MSVDYQKAWDSMNSLEQMSTKILAAHEMLDVARNSLENRKYERIESLIAATQDFIEYYLKEFDEKFKVAWNETVVASKIDGFSWETPDPYNQLSNTSITDDDIGSYPLDFHKFNLGWNESMEAPKAEAIDPKGNIIDWLANPTLTEDRIDNFPVDYNRPPWVDCPDGFEASKKKTWTLPVEEVKNDDTGENEYLITLPEDLLEQTGWKEGTELNWIDNGNGSYSLKEIYPDPYKNDMIASGYDLVNGVCTRKPKTYDEVINDGFEMTADGFWIKS